MNRYSLLLMVLVASVSSATTVYKVVDENGHVTYSDQPAAADESVEIIVLTPYAAPVDAVQLAKQRIDQMAEVTERLQQDRTARQEERQSRLAGGAPLPQPQHQRSSYIPYPAGFSRLRAFPDVRRGYYPDRLRHPRYRNPRFRREPADLSAPPPPSPLLTPRKPLLTPRR